ncbi:MAG: ATP-binding cassette domain-containing protein [Verrucomicrobiales bacterium]|nr:ATP-binding cassette domain-containing protein [Verrucomicrobiales bacterium]
MEETENHALIEIHDFSVEKSGGFDDRNLRLRRISLTINAGEIWVFGGEAGSGKSMLCEYIAGVARRRTKVTGGQVLIDGRTSKGKPYLQRSPLVSFIGREPEAAFNPHHSVEHSLREFSRLIGRSGRRGKELDWNEEFYAVGIIEPERILPRVISDLPLMMLQRLSLMRALMAQSRVIVCDEATCNLDRIAEGQFVDLISQIREERGVTFVLSMGSLRNAERFADHLAMFFEGGILESGPAALLISKPDFSYTREFLATSPKLSHSPHELPVISREAIIEAEEKVHGSSTFIAGENDE